jgi:hypothetical protein
MTTLLTTDLLSVWTDPDTAMEAVGTNLGIFDERVPSPAKVLASDERLRTTLFDVLLSLVEGGALEMRPCGGGRHAFRWREDVLREDAVPAVEIPVVEIPVVEIPVVEIPVVEKPAPVEPVRAPVPAPPPTATPDPIPIPTADADVPVVAEISAPTPDPHSSRPIAQAPLLVIPAMSCLVGVLLYLWFDHTVALALGAVFVIGGVIGMIRRVQFAGAWTLGLVAAGLLLRFS